MGHSENCRICQSKLEFIFDFFVLSKYKIKYFQCTNCGFAQTEKPFWLDEAYERSMNLGDTGQVNRNLNNSVKIRYLVQDICISSGQFLDYAGGYGLFTRLMRDFGYNFFWEDKFTENIFALGSEASHTDRDWYEAITVFECFEHWEDPLSEIKQLFMRTDTIFFTTSLITSPAPKPADWWYYGFDHGQHISFFSKKSLVIISNLLGCYFFSKNGIHILTRKKISLFRLFLASWRSKLLLHFLGTNSKNSLVNRDHFRLIKQVD